MAEMEIRLSGSGGQGILLIGRILGEALTMNGLKVAQSQSYEPTSRGGLSRSDLVVSDHAVDYPLVSVLDYLVVLDKIAAGASDALLKSPTLVIVDRALEASWRATRGQLLFLPIAETARRLGNIRSTNMVALGALLALGDICDEASVFAAIARVAPPKLVESAKEAVKEGYAIARSAPPPMAVAQSAEIERLPLVPV